MSIQKPPKRLVIRWTTLKGLAAIILFLIISALTEYFIVLYAINLGVKDTTLLQWSIQFPGTDWIITISISPLFHLVPIAVIITLLFSWTYLTRHVAVKPHEASREKVRPVSKQGKKLKSEEVGKLTSKISHAVKKFFGKIKSGLLRVKGVAYLWQKIHFARATIKSALTVLLVFSTFILIVSLLAYPKLIHQTISNAYQNNPSLLNFVKDTTEALAPIGGTFSSLNKALLSAAPGFRDFALGLGTIIKPLADLDNAGKYLFFQNVAAWISALTALFYGEYIGKTRRYRKSRS
ncbi:MAG: hypothetical protein WAN82_07205 [Candidatus Bathyarchaeia archaeon]